MVKGITLGHERESGEYDTHHNPHANKQEASRLGVVPTTGKASNEDGSSTFPFVPDPFDNGVGVDFLHVNVVRLAASPPVPFSARRLPPNE
jgi:hypothetical protein